MQFAGRRLVSAHVAEAPARDDREEAEGPDKRVLGRVAATGPGGRAGPAQRKTGKSRDPAAHGRAPAHTQEQR